MKTWCFIIFAVANACNCLGTDYSLTNARIFSVESARCTLQPSVYLPPSNLTRRNWALYFDGVSSECLITKGVVGTNALLFSIKPLRIDDSKHTLFLAVEANGSLIEFTTGEIGEHKDQYLSLLWNYCGIFIGGLLGAGGGVLWTVITERSREKRQQAKEARTYKVLFQTDVSNLKNQWNKIDREPSFLLIAETGDLRAILPLFRSPEAVLNTVSEFRDILVLWKTNRTTEEHKDRLTEMMAEIERWSVI